MASGERRSLGSADCIPIDDTDPLFAASKSSIGQDGPSARSSGTSLALHDTPGVKEIREGSITAGRPVSEAMTHKAIERRTDGIPEKTKTSDEDKSNEDPDARLEEKDDPMGRMVEYEAQYSRSRPLVSRRVKAALRLDQSIAYARLIEDRILELERKVRELRYEKPPPPEGPISEFPSNTVDIAYQNWAQFSTEPFEINIKDVESWKHRPEINLEPKPIIEVLLEEPSKSRSNAAKSHALPNKQITETIILNGTDPGGMEYPHLIRIRSRLLLKIIAEATNCRTAIGPHKHRLLFLRPYKLFVKHAKDLRNFLDQLEKNNAENAEKVEDTKKTELENSVRVSGANNSTKMNGDSSLGSSNTMDPILGINSEQARKELRLLITMIETHLSHQIGLQNSLTPQVGKVKFPDLWHIFKPGYEIRSHDPSQIQLYRIIRVSGGRDGTGVWQEPLEEKLFLASKKLKDSGYSSGSFIIEAFYLGFDGTRFGPVNVTFQIRRFEGEKDIVNLPVYPLACDPNRNQTREALVKRGRAFAELSKPKTNAHRKYKGLTLDSKRQEHVESEVIIDIQLAFTAAEFEKPVISSSLEGLVDDDPTELNIRFMDIAQNKRPCFHSGCCGNDITNNDYDIDAEDRADFRQRYKALLDSFEDPESLTDNHKALLPPQVYGFVLRTRKWATFDIDLLKLPDYDDAWDNLVIDTKIKDMVLALVDNHERPHGSRSAIDSALSSVDLVQGKGRGLIILLHGEPGVGKTSTAECVASHTKRPLFPITCGDIGEKAPDVEDHLEKNFQLAHKWGCVLLLDEADVFLAKRGTNDIQRNAIVSVFLRTLEYYSGILFLTTNRVGKIDRAFKSRIHLSLFYPKLDEERTLLIWENNLTRVVKDVEAKGMTIDCREESILDFAKEHFRKLERGGESKRDSRGKRMKNFRKVNLRVWNGRQIRNAFQTAVAIARYEARDKNKNRSHPGENLHLILSDAQFRKVASIAEQFDEYLNDLYGKNEADLAKKDKMWADNEDVGGQMECRRTSRGRDRSESRGRERHAKRKRYTSLDETEDSDESDESHYRSKKTTKRGRRRSRS